MFWAKVAKQKFIMLYIYVSVFKQQKKVQFFTRDHGRQQMKAVKTTNHHHTITTAKEAESECVSVCVCESERENQESMMLCDKSLDNKSIFMCIENWQQNKYSL